MFGLFSSKKYSPVETLRLRTTDFWGWFVEHADQLDQDFENRTSDPDKLARTFGAAVDRTYEGMCWCFGPAMDKAGHHLAFSPEECPHRLLVAEYLVSQAPRLPRWEFYPAKPGGDVSGSSLKIGGANFSFDEIQTALTPNSERQQPDLVAYHPLFAELDEGVRMRILFIALDECLGELATGAQLAGIATSVTPLPHSFALSSLAEQLRLFYDLQEWQCPAAAALWTSLEFSAPDPALPFPRADLIAATTCNPKLCGALHKARGAFEDPLLKCGAAYLFLVIPRENFPDKELVRCRGEIEDGLNAVLTDTASGRVIGGGSGIINCYIDVMITAGRDSITCILDFMGTQHLKTPVELRFFDRKLSRERFMLP